MPRCSLLVPGIAALYALSAGLSAQAAPDVIVGEVAQNYGDFQNVDDYARSGTAPDDIVALAFGTTSCNAGDQPLIWLAQPDNRHPVIAQNLYKLQGDRLTQIGQAWLKHSFAALQENACYNDCLPASGALGVHCSDPYDIGLNQGPFLGPRFEVNPVNGYFNGLTANDHAGHVHTPVSHGLQVLQRDLGVSGAEYFIEGHYISPDDALAGNGNNNVSHRKVLVSGNAANWSFAVSGLTQRQSPAYNAWPGAAKTIVDTWPNDGRIVVIHKSTTLTGTGYFRYEYAVYNMNSHRGIRSFAVPIGTATARNIGFSAVRSHDEGFSNVAWTAVNANRTITWSTPAYAQNPAANALRWGTMYNFWFEANAPAAPSQATLACFQPGRTLNMFHATIVAPAPSDCDGNGVSDAQAIAAGAPDCNTNGIPDACELADNDCDHNAIPDDCPSAAVDCNSNHTPDLCEPPAADCDNNGIPDDCDLADGDCNHNGAVDACDAAAGSDCDSNRIPDECQSDCDFDGTIDPCEIAPDCNSNRVPDACDLTALVGGTFEFPSPVLNLPINAASPVAMHTIQCDLTGIVTDVNIWVDIAHTWDGDLLLSLERGGRTVVLAAGRGDDGDNFTGTTFDDEAARSIAEGAAPFSGSFRPEEPLSTLDGLASAGPWTLTVLDGYPEEDDGRLIRWRLTLQTLNRPAVSQDANSNGVPDECEAGLPGDLNCDGRVSPADIAPFILALINPQAYAAAFPGCNANNADLNNDNRRNARDIPAFVTTLRQG